MKFGGMFLTYSKYASTDGVGFSICHTFKMAALTSFQAEKCCHLVRLWNSVRQFLICSIFVLVCLSSASRWHVILCIAQHLYHRVWRRRFHQCDWALWSLL